MNELLTQLSSFDINVSGRTRAIQSITENGFNDSQYREMLEKLTGVEINEDEYVTQFTFKYLVDQIMVDGNCELETAIEKATKYVDSNPWIKVETERKSYYKPKSTVDAMGNPKQKKGEKKVQAIKLWNERKNENLSRQQWIEILMEKVGMSEKGASTYHYNLRKGIYK